MALPDGRGSSPRVRGKPPAASVESVRCGLIPARAGKTSTTRSRPSERPAHPRACGENPGAVRRRVGREGSSPRVRGKPPAVPGRRRIRGLIPARAGKTEPLSSARKNHWAHPRACGENGRGGAGQAVLQGSSPRVRGKPAGVSQGMGWGGLIPARAGKTRTRLALPLAWPAHPRACGENAVVVAYNKSEAGSSPRVRGKLGQRREGTPLRGLIPARAGKTSSTSRTPGSKRAHPRACGENPAASAMMPRPRGLIPARAGKTHAPPPSASPSPAHPRACGENHFVGNLTTDPEGSSPRVRGKPGCYSWEDRFPRLIPARAGKTFVHCVPHRARWAHPRACGENAHYITVWRTCGGSSPRVRGKHVPHGGPPQLWRLIPARAGKTARRNVPGPAGPAHPRACGENCGNPCPARGQGGSSPRVRGKRRVWRCRARSRRLIPARAGKTRRRRI